MADPGQSISFLRVFLGGTRINAIDKRPFGIATSDTSETGRGQTNRAKPSRYNKKEKRKEQEKEMNIKKHFVFSFLPLPFHFFSH